MPMILQLRVEKEVVKEFLKDFLRFLEDEEDMQYEKNVELFSMFDEETIQAESGELVSVESEIGKLLQRISEDMVTVNQANTLKEEVIGKILLGIKKNQEEERKNFMTVENFTELVAGIINEKQKQEAEEEQETPGGIERKKKTYQPEDADDDDEDLLDIDIDGDDDDEELEGNGTGDKKECLYFVCEHEECEKKNFLPIPPWRKEQAGDTVDNISCQHCGEPNKSGRELFYLGNDDDCIE